MRSWPSLFVVMLTSMAGNLASHTALADDTSVPTAAAAVPPDPKLNFREQGRFGVLGAITEDAWKGGLAFEHEYFEVQILGHMSYVSKSTHDQRLTYKLGARIPLGTLNYFALGADVSHHPGGREEGVSLSRDYSVGPYISLQRYFAATPIMLNLWVNPVQYDHEVVLGDDGQGEINVVWHVLQTGGFGLAYLF
jgi:hypothetical protein